MKIRLGLMLFACLTFASIAAAQTCLDCVNGTCQQSPDNFCTLGCCNMAVGTPCTLKRNVVCASRSPVPYYFTSRMPQQLEGSALRLQFAPAVKAPPLKCAAPTTAPVVATL